MNDVTGEISSQMYMNENKKIIPFKIHVGGSIGMHVSSTSDDIIIYGKGKAICDSKE